jgi:hypothetical protein
MRLKQVFLNRIIEENGLCIFLLFDKDPCLAFTTLTLFFVTWKQSRKKKGTQRELIFTLV